MRSKKQIKDPQKILVIGSSNGYSLAALIVSAFAGGAVTIRIAYERPGSSSSLPIHARRRWFCQSTNTCKSLGIRGLRDFKNHC